MIKMFKHQRHFFHVTDDDCITFPEYSNLAPSFEIAVRSFLTFYVLYLQSDQSCYPVHELLNVQLFLMDKNGIYSKQGAFLYYCVSFLQHFFSKTDNIHIRISSFKMNKFISEIYVSKSTVCNLETHCTI